MIGFEVQINDEAPVTAGAEDLSVLTAILTMVFARQDLSLRVGGMISRSATDNEMLDWVDRRLQAGDTVKLKSPSAPPARRPCGTPARIPTWRRRRNGSTTSA